MADTSSFQSLNVIRDELVATIEQAARDLENYVAEGGELQSFHACVAGIRQIIGILRMLEFGGASILAEELLATAEPMKDGVSGPGFEKRLELVTNTFFVLSRYLEYVQQSKRKAPVLLIPYINELRKFRREHLFPESHYFHANLNANLMPPASDAINVRDAEFAPLMVRLRHMYQLGLLGVLRDKQARASLGLMRRSTIRLQRLGNDKPLSLLWWMSNMAIDALIQQKMDLNEPRKLLLSRIDRVIRQVQKGGRAAYQAAAPKGLIKELLYIVILSGARNPHVDLLKRTYGVSSLPYTDKQLELERQKLRGPSAQTISSLVRVLKVEIENIKKVLEQSSVGTQEIADVDELREVLRQVSETMSVVGLAAPASILKEEIERMKLWQNSQEVSESELERAAKIMLYMESAIDSLELEGQAVDAFSNTSEESQNKVIATNELAQAERIVLHECESGIQMTERAITAYSESNFDPSHISNIVKTLHSVRGGFQILNRQRAAVVTEKCALFVEEVLLDSSAPPALKELLETFADAIISVEYFLDTANTASRLDDTMLEVAEESLAALGYPVASH